ncbi:MAG TPA: sulfotransferase family protein [Thermoanaerobaculia bacterium]|nr:sulfotransferase family protein [Thermoanaerobaculia bacterium]
MEPPRGDTLRLNVWSGPRNVSTALMYAFAQRPDTRVVDEPLYGHYLRVSEAAHPHAEEVLRRMDTDGERVVREVILGPCDRPVLFLKQMAHHLVDLDRGFLAATANVLLTRHPRDVLPTLAEQLPQPVLRDTGYAAQTEFLDELRALGQPALVLDAAELLRDPEGVLRRLCGALGIPWEPAMLEWEAGPKPYDGCWAPDWYHNVHRSTGFAPYRPKTAPFPERLAPLLAECLPRYERLYAVAIKAGEG